MAYITGFRTFDRVEPNVALIDVAGLILPHIMHSDAHQIKLPNHVVGYNMVYRSCEQHWNTVLLLSVLLVAVTNALYSYRVNHLAVTALDRLCAL